MQSQKKKSYIVRLLASNARLPSYVSFFEAKARDADERLGRIEQALQSIHTELEALEHLGKLDDGLADVRARLNVVATKLERTPGKSASAKVNNTVSDNHLYDAFYKKFEDSFRGDEALIKDRVSEHMSYFQALPPKLQRLPVVDVGCGRGEFLSVLEEKGFTAVGIDMNADMVQRAKENGFTAVQNDALTYLRETATSSVSAVTGFHIVEHIPFEALMQIFEECYRVVARKGFVLFETPNPHSLLVGANTFYLDPSHQRPIPPELLAFMLSFVGFKTKIVPLHKIKTHAKNTPKVVAELYDRVYGYADYAVIGSKN